MMNHVRLLVTAFFPIVRAFSIDSPCQAASPSTVDPRVVPCIRMGTFQEGHRVCTPYIRNSDFGML